jgi:DegV family protein with EDD domain
MIKQQSDAHKEHFPIAVIVDSGCDLPEEILESLNIHVIPVRLNFGDVHYVDKVSLTSQEFWKEMKNNPIHPQTSQPSPGDFRRQYQFLSSHYDSAISIHIPKKLSGTFQSAVTASKTVSNFPIEVSDSINGSVGMGLVAMSTAQAVQDGKNFNEVCRILENAINNTTIYIGFDKLDNVVKGGRISHTVKKIANFFRINPIITFKEEGIKTIGITFGNNNKANKFKKYAESKIPTNQNFRVGIAHTQMKEFASKWSKDLQKRFGEDNVVLTEVGPALGVHSGPGSLIFAIQILDDN